MYSGLAALQLAKLPRRGGSGPSDEALLSVRKAPHSTRLRPLVLYLVTEDWYFHAHRLSLARAAKRAGYTVAVATRVGHFGPAIEAEGFQLIRLRWERGTLNPLRIGMELWEIANVYRKMKPDIVHHVSTKSIILGSTANLFCIRLPSINAFTGLGLLFSSPRARERVLAAAVSFVLRRTLNKPQTITLLENEDDRRVVITRFGLPEQKTLVNPGSGVDTDVFRPLPPPQGHIPCIACCSRMLESKGIQDLVAASDLLMQQNIAHRVILAGAPDPDNPKSISGETLKSWSTKPNIEWVGHVPDVRQVWAEADIAVLPSHGGEGVPLSLVEAAACGRPLVATDVPGCRDIVQDGLNGLLVPVGNACALTGVLARLVDDEALRKRMGEASVRLVAEGFTGEIVNSRTLMIYRAILDGDETAV